MAKKNKLTFPEHFVVVIGKPLISLEEAGLNCCPKKTLHTEERSLARILVELEIFPSISEIRKNRKEVMIQLDKLNFLTFKFGHRIVDILVGE